MKKQMLKVLSAMLCIVLLLSALTIPSFAVTASGTCGENVSWNFDGSTGMLTVSGTGNMRDFSYYSVIPWRSQYNDKIRTVLIEDGVTSIGNNAFSECINLNEVLIGNSVGVRMEDKEKLFDEITEILYDNDVCIDSIDGGIDFRHFRVRKVDYSISFDAGSKKEEVELFKLIRKMYFPYHDVGIMKGKKYDYDSDSGLSFCHSSDSEDFVAYDKEKEVQVHSGDVIKNISVVLKSAVRNLYHSVFQGTQNKGERSYLRNNTEIHRRKEGIRK